MEIDSALNKKQKLTLDEKKYGIYFVNIADHMPSPMGNQEIADIPGCETHFPLNKRSRSSRCPTKVRKISQESRLGRANEMTDSRVRDNLTGCPYVACALYSIRALHV